MLKNKKGQGMVEYILIIAVAVVIILVGVKLFGGKVSDVFKSTSEKIATEASAN